VPGIGWLIGFVESWSVGDAVYFTFVTGLLFRGPYRVSKILLRKHPRESHRVRPERSGAPTARGDTMTTHTYASIASIATLAAFTVIGPVCAGGDKLAFPENHEAGVLFTTVDRSDNKQFREVYTSAATLEAAKNGEPLPDGTVITMLQYAAKLDAQGNPEKDANGRFIKGNLIGYAVMEKRTGWGSEYPDNVRNGEWEYQSFKADKTVNSAANLSACFTCHKPLDKQDYVFLYDRMKAAAK
jgi:Cytochrome P460